MPRHACLNLSFVLKRFFEPLNIFSLFCLLFVFFPFDSLCVYFYCLYIWVDPTRESIKITIRTTTAAAALDERLVDCQVVD